MFTNSIGANKANTPEGKRWQWFVFGFFSVTVGLYPGIYFIIDRKQGLLGTKSDELLANPVYNAAFYSHITLGGLALLIGWIQFNLKFRNKNLRLHKQIGKVYVVSALLSSLAGLYIAFFATGGLIASLGFTVLGFVWLYATWMAYWEIRNGRVVRHQKMMVYSYAACFAAVALRVWLPLLALILGDFTTAYIVVSWLCWIPNLVVAYFINNRAKHQEVLLKIR